MNSSFHLPVKKGRSPRGFALVVTVSLMIMVTLLAVAMISLSSVSMRISQNGGAVLVARANARMAMMLAIGELQKYAGPDQRVTAAAAIRNATVNGKWTGVWSTTDLNKVAEPMVGPYQDAAGRYFSDKRSTDRTLMNGTWKDKLRLTWLVSGDAPTPAGTIPANMKCELVGKGTLGDNPAAEDLVSVSKVNVINAGTGIVGGSYAYWVGDESIKARIDQGSPSTVTPDRNAPQNGGYARLAGADGPGFAKVKAGTSLPYTDVDAMAAENRHKILSPSTVGLALGEAASKELPKKNFHDITTRSLGVLADVRAGGLRKDLTSYLESASAVPAVTGVAGTGMASDQPILPSTVYQETGPSFQHFKNWYDLRKKVTGTALGAGSIDPQYIDGRADTSGGYNEGMTVDVLKKTQPVQPVLAGMHLAFDFSLDSSRGAGRGVRVHLYPRVTLWNPYNVTLKGARYVVGCTLPPIGGNVRVGDKSIVTLTGDPNQGKMFDQTVQNDGMVYFVTSPIDFGPGECLVFSPDYSTSTGGPKLGGNASRYDSSNICANVLSASVPSGQNNFYFSSGYAVDASVNLAATPVSYGVVRDVNAAISSGLTMVMKKATSSNISYPMVKQADCSTLSVMRMDYNGKKLSWWWDVFALNTEPVNNAAFPGFIDYNTSPNHYPPRLWYVGGRLRWLDETDEQQALGQQWGAGAGLLYHNPVIGNFNVRAPTIFRSQFCFYDDWTRYAPGPAMIPWVTPRLGDPRMQLPFVGGKSYGSPFGLPSDWSAVKSYAMFEVPQKDMPLFSLATFQHAQLGFYGWQPTYVVGNSLAEPRSTREASAKPNYVDASASGTAWGDGFAKHTPGSWGSLIQNKTSEVLAYDISFSVNQMLWDRYFLSTIPYTAGSTTWDPDTTTLPNSRLVYRKPADFGASTLTKLVANGKAFDYAAYLLMNEGAFNVNSTSVEAWRAFLSTLNRVSRPTATGADAGPLTFSRLLVPRSSANSAGSRIKIKTQSAWEGVRTLTDTEIDVLAKQMVVMVKARGPFLGMADFVNRRLTPSTLSTFDDESYCGPLQAALEKSSINAGFKDDATREGLTNRDGGGSNPEGSGGMYKPDPNSYFSYKLYGAPGYLTQADVLQTLAPSLTTRGDTFVIRAYGEARDPSGVILAKAYCEATVQRTPDYLQSVSLDSPSGTNGNNPLEPMTTQVAGSLALVANSKILPTNVKFGRRFKITEFHWLNPNEI